MTVTVANTLVSNTWDFMRLRVNQLADVMTRQAVTVGGNTAVGNASITGALTANILNSGVTNSNLYYGTWVGNTVGVPYGGTGVSAPPPNGSILIGANGQYVVNAISNGTGITVTPGNGSITIINSGVTSFRTATNTANVFSAPRTGDITLTSSDVINALGFLPSVSNTAQWLRAGTDLNYYQGNVAIGYSDNNPRSAASLMILAYDTANNTPGLQIENVGNNSTSGAYINLTVANTSSYTGIRFQNNRSNDGAIEYSPSVDFLRFSTAGKIVGGFDASGNFGLGTVAPSPNKGGNGSHIQGTNPGITLDNGSGTQWIIGQNPNASMTGGIRLAGQFAIFSDTSNTGILFANTTSNTQVSFYVSGSNKVNIDSNGRVRMSSNTFGTAVLQVGGDVATEGNFVTQSDYRLKENIETLSEKDALRHINSLNPVSFGWKKNGKKELGFIAHEVQLVIPTAVKGEKDGEDIQTIDKSQLTPSIVKSIQALINIVNKQQEEINRLKGK